MLIPLLVGFIWTLKVHFQQPAVEAVSPFYMLKLKRKQVQNHFYVMKLYFISKGVQPITVLLCIHEWRIVQWPSHSVVVPYISLND